MHPSVQSVNPQDNYQLHITFDNGEQGILDMKPYLNFGVFTRIKDQQIFAQVRTVFDTIEWPTGIDLDPEFIYQKTLRQ